MWQAKLVSGLTPDPSYNSAQLLTVATASWTLQTDIHASLLRTVHSHTYLSLTMLK